MISLTDDLKVQYGILLLLWIEYLWEAYLSVRQNRVCKKTTSLPVELGKVMTQETFNKARLYALDKNKFSMIKAIFSTIVTSLIIYYGLFYKFWIMASDLNPWQGEIIQSCIWLVLVNTLSTILYMPFTVYFTFIVEEKYGFNKQTAGFFVWDKIKAYILSQLLSVPVAALAIYIVQIGGDYFFVWLWLCVGIILMVLLTVWPAYIAPLFDKYEPLPNGELRTAIENLAGELKFPLKQLYVVEGSKRSAHSNAYFYGLFGEKRIVLFDTLLKPSEDDSSDTGCDHDEVLAVLSHELGHWQYGHVNKNIIIIQVNMLLIFSAFAFTFGYSPLYQSLGFPTGNQPILVGLIIVVQYVLAPYNAILSFLLTVLSRKFEFQADNFAVKLGRGEPLKRALIKLNRDNLGFPIYDKLFSSWHLSHPALLERIAAMNQIETTEGKKMH